jgi:hypothetical protein
MIDDPKFAAFMEAVLQPCGEVRLDSVNSTDSGKIADAILMANFSSLELRILQMELARRLSRDSMVILSTHISGLRPNMVFIDDLMEMGHIENFRFFQSPLVDEPQEPRAKNGALASKKTQAAKAKLPFYHKNRRF